LTKCTATNTFKFIITQGLRQYYFERRVEFCFFTDITSECRYIVTYILLNVNSYVVGIWSRQSYRVNIEVMFVIEVFICISELLPCVLVFDVKVDLHNVICLLVQGIHDLVIEQTAYFAHLLVDTWIFYRYFLTMTCIPHHNLIIVEINYNYCIIVSVVIDSDSHLSIKSK